MLYNTEAIVVRSIAYGEANVIITLLTPSGLVAAMARGAKKPQSKFVAGVQLCVQGVYSIYQRSGMGTVQQVEIIDAQRSLREDLQQAAYAAYFCELVLAIAEERPDGSEAVYRLFLGALNRLRLQTEAPPVLARIWEAKVLRFLGASPDWTSCVRCGNGVHDGPRYSMVEGGMVCPNCYFADPRSDSKTMLLVPKSMPRILMGFEQVSWERLGQVTLSEDTLTALRRVLDNQLRDFAGVSPKSREFLRSIDDVLKKSDD